jgi:hypothetical protein
MSLDTFMEEYNKLGYRNPFNESEIVVDDKNAIDIAAPYGSKDMAVLRTIRSFEKGKGSGTDTLEKILKLANKHKVKVQVYVKPFDVGGLNKKQLLQWYKRHGFKGKDYMVYIPIIEKKGSWAKVIDEIDWHNPELMPKDIALPKALYRSSEDIGWNERYNKGKPTKVSGVNIVYFTTDPAMALYYADKTPSKAVDRFRIKRGAKIYDENKRGKLSGRLIKDVAHDTDIIVPAESNERYVINLAVLEKIPYGSRQKRKSSQIKVGRMK